MIKLRKVLNYKQIHGVDRAAMHRPMVTLDCERSGMDNYSMDRSTGFRMDVRILINFWANQAQFSDAYKNAEKQILREIYGDVIDTIHEVQNMLFSGDIPLAQTRLAKLEQDLMEPSDDT